MRFKVFIVSVLFVGILLSGISFAQNKVVVIPLIDDGITCKGKLVGTRWCDQQNGTVLDMTTGLVWLKKADGGSFWPWRRADGTGHWDAHTESGLLQHGSAGLSDGSEAGDWRLPRYSEMRNLGIGSQGIVTGAMHPFINVLKGVCYWTSGTASAFAPHLALYVQFDTGVVGGGTEPKETSCYVWSVRRAD